MANIDSVSDLINKIKYSLESEFQNNYVEGEISNLSKSTAGHWYFTLSDKIASISVALFKMDAYKNRIINKVKDGDKIKIVGPISVYQKRGTFQVIAKNIEKSGKGDLLQTFNELKEKLKREGLFDLERKQEIPNLPSKIAVITAPQSAAIKDFINIFRRRSHSMNLLIVPAVVQGDKSARSVINGIDKIEQINCNDPQNKIEVIVITRGGGSIEDLWPFNDEQLARKIFNCQIPIISAIGHEVDYSISDFVADKRCETPSAAAEELTQYQVTITDQLNNTKNRLLSSIKMVLSIKLNSLDRVSPSAIVNKLWMRFNSLTKRLNNSNLFNRGYEITKLYELNYNIDECLNRLSNYIQQFLQELTFKTSSYNKTLHSLNPKNVLQRGYSYLTDTNDNKIINSKEHFSRLKKGTLLNISFHDGQGDVIKK